MHNINTYINLLNNFAQFLTWATIAHLGGTGRGLNFIPTCGGESRMGIN